MTRWYLVTLLALAFPAMVVAAPGSFSSSVQPLLAKYCVECHSAKTSEGELNLTALKPDWNDGTALDRWVKVFQRVSAGEMPPADSVQPSASEKRQLLGYLRVELLSAMSARQATEGRVELRRLNRVEYQNTMHDLLGIETNVMELLPEDAQALGFDKISTALTLSPVQMEKYLEAADVALDAAISTGPAPKVIQERYAAKELIPGWSSSGVRNLDDADQSVVLFNSGYSPTELRKFRAPAPGRYRIRVSAHGFQTQGEPAKLRVYAGNFGVGGKTKLLGHYAVPADKPTVIELIERIDGRGDSVKVAPYGTISWQKDGATYAGPGLALQWIEIEGPLEAREWPPVTRRKLLGDVDLEKGTLADAKTILRNFAPRAFRRPTNDDELAPYFQLVAERLEQDVKFADALRVGLKAVLVSPRFLFLDEQPGKLDGHALAARLSYFLWSTMPDVELVTAAERGDLADDRQLAAQVERMLNSPKAAAFTRDFTGQWLGLRNIEFTTPDGRLYPEFDEWLQVSMVGETHAFFDELLKHDLSLLNFIHSDFAMLNERLADHYKIPDVSGVEIRKVLLKPEWHRGGVMTQASILKVTANGTTTSPVLRGVWIADRILGQPIPPPPANVAAVEPDIRGAKSIRDQLAKHREVASCATCHTRIDPLGFALESYDVIGGWRDRYRISPERNQRADWVTLVVNHRDMRIALGPTVDPSDTLADGQRFQNLAELQQHLLAKPDSIARGLAEKLLVYATGHGLTFADDEAVDNIVEQVKSKNFGFRTLVKAVVQSELFRKK